jgi:hypothetical protein
MLARPTVRFWFTSLLSYSQSNILIPLGVDEHCQPDPENGFNGTGIWLDISIRFYANIILPFVGTIIDTDLVGKLLDPSYTGFLWKKTLWGMCADMDVVGFFEEKVNQKFKEITAKINHETLEEYDEYMPVWGDNGPNSTIPSETSSSRPIPSASATGQSQDPQSSATASSTTGSSNASHSATVAPTTNSPSEPSPSPASASSSTKASPSQQTSAFSPTSSPTSSIASLPIALPTPVSSRPAPSPSDMSKLPAHTVVVVNLLGETLGYTKAVVFTEGWKAVGVSVSNPDGETKMAKLNREGQVVAATMLIVGHLPIRPAVIENGEVLGVIRLYTPIV